MKYLVILFAVVAIVAAYPDPEQERERRGILGAPLATTILAAPRIAPAAVVAAPAAKLLAAPVAAGPWAAAPWGARAW